MPKHRPISRFTTSLPPRDAILMKCSSAVRARLSGLQIRMPRRNAGSWFFQGFVRQQYSAASCCGLFRDNACRYPLYRAFRSRKTDRLCKSGRCAVSLFRVGHQQQRDDKVTRNRGCDENEKAARTVSGYGAGSTRKEYKTKVLL